GWIKWWILGVTIFALFLAWGHNMMWFTNIFIDYVPLYNKFRTVSTILVIVQWSVPLLGMLALQKIYGREVDSPTFTKAFKRALIVTCSIALFFIVLGGSFMDFSSASDGKMGLPDDVIAAMQSERADMMRMDAIRSLIFVLLAAIIVFAMQKEKIKRGVAVLAITVLVTIDMVGVDIRFLNYDHFVSVKKSLEIQPTVADLQILQDKDPNFRVANMSVSPFQDAQTSYFHKSIGGYHAAKMRRYQDIIDRYLSKMYMGVYNMLNTKYFITKDDQGQLAVQYNSAAFGNCWFVDSVAYVKNADEEINALENVHLRSVAVVDEKFKKDIENVVLTPTDTTASIKLVSYKVNDLVYKSSSSKDEIALFSEIYYPKGWSAYIDGVEVPYFRADYILRAIVVPKGNHTIEFKFAAPNFALFKGITASCSIILILIFRFFVFVFF
ncbi:MAG: YfhO family protein, partial [Rikenellaceae bacterium]